MEGHCILWLAGRISKLVLSLWGIIETCGLQAEAAGRITQGAILSAYEAVRFKKAQPKLTGGSWTSLEKLQVLLTKEADISKSQKSVERSSAMAKGAIVTR